MIDTNEQLKKMFEPFQQVDPIGLGEGKYQVDRLHPIYWICVDNSGDLCCGKSTVMNQVLLVLASSAKQILFFKRRENV